MTAQVLALLVAAGAPAPDEPTAPATAPTEPETPPSVNAPATPPPQVTAPPAQPPPPEVVVQLVREDPGALRERLEWHDERDKDLRGLTIGFGIATVAFTLIGAPMLAAAGKADTTGKARALTSGGAAMVTFASTMAIGTIISAVVLGNHRNHRGFFL